MPRTSFNFCIRLTIFPISVPAKLSLTFQILHTLLSSLSSGHSRAVSLNHLVNGSALRYKIIILLSSLRTQSPIIDIQITFILPILLEPALRFICGELLL